jgi:hypothetical protein
LTGTIPDGVMKLAIGTRGRGRSAVAVAVEALTGVNASRRARGTCSRATSISRVARRASWSTDETASTSCAAPRAGPSRRSAPFAWANASDLRDHDGRTADPRRGDLRHLRDEGLVQVVRIEGHWDPAVVLTDRGKALLESHRLDRAQEPCQAFYAGLRKPRELEHDSQLYAAYLRAAERLEARGGRVERVVLDYEIKRDYQRFLQDRNRNRSDSDGRPDRQAHEIAAWARQHELPYFDEQMHIPDVRIEYEDGDGRMRHLDIEVETPHYRGAHAAAASRSGFACYRVSSARIGCGGRAGGGGRSGPDPRIIEELLR